MRSMLSGDFLPIRGRSRFRIVHKNNRLSDRGKYGQEALTSAFEANHDGCRLKKAERNLGALNMVWFRMQYFLFRFC